MLFSLCRVVLYGSLSLLEIFFFGAFEVFCKAKNGKLAVFFEKKEENVLWLKKKL